MRRFENLGIDRTHFRQQDGFVEDRPERQIQTCAGA